MQRDGIEIQPRSEPELKRKDEKCSELGKYKWPSLAAGSLLHASFRRFITIVNMSGRNITIGDDHPRVGNIPRSRPRLMARPFDQPLQYGVKIGLFLRADTVAANLAVRYSLEVQRIYKLIHGELFRKIRLVAKNQERYAVKDWLL